MCNTEYWAPWSSVILSIQVCITDSVILSFRILCHLWYWVFNSLVICNTVCSTRHRITAQSLQFTFTTSQKAISLVCNIYIKLHNIYISDHNIYIKQYLYQTSQYTHLWNLKTFFSSKKRGVGQGEGWVEEGGGGERGGGGMQEEVQVSVGKVSFPQTIVWDEIFLYTWHSIGILFDE